MYVWRRYEGTTTTVSKPISGQNRSTHTKPIVQADMKRVKRNPLGASGKQQVSLGFHVIYAQDI